MAIRERLSDTASRLGIDDETLRPAQLAIAAYGFVLFALANEITKLGVKALKQAAALARTLAILALVYGTYYLVAEMVNRPLSIFINRLTEEIASRGDLSERAQNLVSLAITAAIAYATYRLVKWATIGIIESLGAPNPGQTSVDEFLDKTDDELTEADTNPDHPLHESNQ